MCSVSIKGSPYGHFRRALEIGKLPMVLAAAAGLPRLQLDDALEVLALMAEQSPPERYQAAAARWCGRLALERGASLAQLRLAVAACELLPEHPAGIRVLRALCRPRRPPGAPAAASDARERNLGDRTARPDRRRA